MAFTLQLDRIQQKFHQIYDPDEEDKEEEALSLCDLPVSSRTTEEQQKEEDPTREEDDSGFDFDFGSLIGSINPSESEMCAADEIFSGGQMLPFRHSISSEAGFPGHRIQNRSVFRSESMDRVRFGSRSNSSRSSSTRSHQSTASSSTTTSSSGSSFNNTLGEIKTTYTPKPKARNQFYSYPSPRPQVRASGARLSTSSTPPPTKSTMWQVLRLGLVRTPEIELQGRTSNYSKTINSFTIRNDSINSSRSSSSNNEDPIIGSKISDLILEVQRRKNSNNRLLSHESKSGGFFKSCKCSVGAIEPIQTTTTFRNQMLNEDKKLAEKKQKQEERQDRQKQKQKQGRQGKQGMSHHRTFEWLRDLSHASVLNS